jgi:Flp pilus assembly protein TadG
MIPKKQKQQGAAMVEFVLVLPFLITLLFGIVEFSNVLMQMNTLNKATMNASRYLSLKAIQENGIVSVDDMGKQVGNLIKCGKTTDCNDNDPVIMAENSVVTDICVNPKSDSCHSGSALTVNNLIRIDLDYPYVSVFKVLFGTNIIPDFNLHSTVLIQAI